MASRKRRSLLGKSGSEGEEEREEATPPGEAASGPASEPEPGPFADPGPFAEAAPEPPASEPRAPEPPAAAEPGFQRQPPLPSEPMFTSFGDLPDDDDPFAAVAVNENRNAAGRTYTDTSKANNDTTDDAWSGSAWGKGQDSLPPGWGGGTPEPAQPRPPEPMRRMEKGYFEGDEEPPTEEHPSAVYEDHSHAYSAPMNVPEPPPIPGLFDRFTPPPVQRKTFTSTPEDRPKYQATPHPAPSRGEPTGAAFKPTSRKADDDDEEDDDEPRGGVPVVYLMGGGVAVLGAIMLAVILVVMANMGKEPPAPAGPPPRPPEIVKTAPPPPPPELTDTDAAVAGAAADAAGSATTAVTPPPDPTPVIPKTTTPKTKTPVKASTTKEPADKKGTLKIRSNRRVLVKINGQPRDYSPLDLPLVAGKYSISAALPGKPESEKVIEVTLKAGAVEPVNFNF